MRNAKLYCAAETLSLWYISVVLSTIILGKKISFSVEAKWCHRIKKMQLCEAWKFGARPRRIFSTESKIGRSIRLVYLAYQTHREKLVGGKLSSERNFSSEIFNWTITATTCDARFFLSASFSLFSSLLCYRFALGKFYHRSFFKSGPSMGIMEAGNGCMRTA